ncbi:hypothetical protein RvY_05970 [Ramazzottius varieornatus]|uniref:RRM domain-containing protein n=1 Tax=Ramazzottius varieornatus TaxID=947166 RepID=A0A1D1UWZ2_RAMVA|nr:hypothetical protein RvY_05970 [Ramazzottius varieornatus]
MAQPNSTLYVNNLNEKVKKEELKKSLYHLFSQFGSVLDIVALKTIKMRGQAFIVFKDIGHATAALRSLQGTPFYNKNMKIDFALTESEATQKMKGTFKMRKPDAGNKDAAAKKKKKTGDEAVNGMEHFAASFAESSSITNGDAEAAPNRILFLTDLPPSYTEDTEMISSLFSQHSGFKEVRLVPGRNDIAFVEFDHEASAAAARDSLNGFKITPTNPLNITFANR